MTYEVKFDNGKRKETYTIENVYDYYFSSWTDYVYFVDYENNVIAQFPAIFVMEITPIGD